jgi:chaperonin GroES
MYYYLTFFVNATIITPIKNVTKERKMAFKPLANRVLVFREEEANTTASGIIIPDNAKEKPLQGKVLAVGPDCEDIKVGDTIVFAKYTGTEIVIDDKECLILASEDVLGIIE